MGKWLNWIFIALIAYGIYRLSFRHTETENPPQEQDVSQVAQPPQPVAPKALPPTQDVAPVSVPKPEPTAPKVVSAPPQPEGKFRPLPPNAVPFKLVNGLIVSYGDIVLGRPTVDEIPNEGFAEKPKPIKWGRNVIPYLIAPDLPNPDRVYRALQYMNENTTIEFVPATNEKDAIVFEKTDEHCYSYLGRVGGHQPVYLSSDCYEPEITHELMHVLGFVHEQSRPDRDQYVTIHVDRIQEDKLDQFQVVPDSLVEKIKDRPFDYRSVMLYRPTAFAKKSGEITMESLKPEQAVDPVRTGLSEEDIKRIEREYPEN